VSTFLDCYTSIEQFCQIVDQNDAKLQNDIEPNCGFPLFFKVERDKLLEKGERLCLRTKNVWSMMFSTAD
jgi:hypothetical protein